MRIYLRISTRFFNVSPKLGFFLGSANPASSYVTCPECATADVRQLNRLDQVDRLARVPFSAIQRCLGGRLYHCSRCRLQFYDCRKKCPSVCNRPGESGHTVSGQ